MNYQRVEAGVSARKTELEYEKLERLLDVENFEAVWAACNQHWWWSCDGNVHFFLYSPSTFNFL